MPLYEYKCDECDHVFEELVQGADQPECPRCESVQLEKLFSAFAVNGPQGAMPDLDPGACGTCGDPRGPGACSLN